MKTILTVLFGCLLSMPAFADIVPPPTPPPAPTTTESKAETQAEAPAAEAETATAATEAAPTGPTPDADGVLKYRINSGESLIYALVYKHGMAAAIAHDHVIHASKLEGKLNWNPTDDTRRYLKVTATVADFLPDADTLRTKVGLPLTLSDKDRGTILTHILDEGQLWLAKHNTISFASTAIEGTLEGDSGTVEVMGNLTIRGQRRPISLKIQLEKQGEKIRAKGKFRILQSNFGYKPYSALFGTLKVKDEVDIVLDMTLEPI